jgi:hypothetical protein
VTIDRETVLQAAREYPALAMSAARAAEIAAEIADLERACDEAVQRFGRGDADAFAAELLRHSRPDIPRR